MNLSSTGRARMLALGLLLAACSEDAGETEPAIGTGGSTPASAAGALQGGSAGSVAPSSSGGTSGGSGATGASGSGGASGGAIASGGSPVATGGTSTGGASGGANAGAATGGTTSGPTVPSSGCGQMDAESGVLPEQTIEVAGEARTYVLSVPSDYQAEKPYPLVFAWHGLGGSGTLARSYFRIEPQSKGGGIFVYPDGLLNDEGKAGWDLAADGIDVALFDALLEKVSAAYCVDTKRVFSTGHSFGGFFTERLGCSRGEVLRGIAPVAGGPPFGGSANCATSVAAWITHGSNDGTVDFATGEAGRDLWLAANGCGDGSAPVSPEPCVAYEGCSEPVHWCVHEDEHAWPGFAAAGIWAFFSGLN